MQDLRDTITIKLEGHVKIFEYEDFLDVGSDRGQIILDKRNAIHNENASIMISRGIANRSNGAFYTMNFGTGGATVNPLGNIIFAAPNTTGAADLNRPVYFEIIDDTLGAPQGNQMAIRHINGTLFSDVEIRCVLDKNEPFGQPASDNLDSQNVNNSQFSFNEIGLKTSDGLLVTHVVFAPVLKAANRIFEVVYTIRVRIAT